MAMPTLPLAQGGEALLEDLSPAQREAVRHDAGPLLILAGAGTGKTTVIARRVAWLIATGRAQPEEILALTFSEKAAREMEERVDLLVPYGYVGTTIRTFHAFGDGLIREHAARLGLSPQLRVFSGAEQLAFLRRHLFDLPLTRLRPSADPGRYLPALAEVFGRAKDEAVTPEEFLSCARALEPQAGGEAALELARSYGAYQQLLRQADAVDFGDQVLLAIQLLEQHPDVRQRLQQTFRCVLVDEFQDTNYAQFKLLRLLAPSQTDLAVVADDDQSIYQWRGAALSNILKFLQAYEQVRTVVLTDNFRSSQAVLDCAYRLIRHNDPERLEVRQGVDKRLVARSGRPEQPPQLQVFDTASAEADWVAKTIRAAIETSGRRPSDFAILVRSNRDADLFLRALNVAGIPWRFSGASNLLAREDIKTLVSCLRTLGDPADTLSWFHVATSRLYQCPMPDLTLLLASARKAHLSFRRMAEQYLQTPELRQELSEAAQGQLQQLLEDVDGLLELSRTRSPGQLLYEWLAQRGVLAQLGRAQRAEDALELQGVARFFDMLHRIEPLAGDRLAGLLQHFDLFEALGQEPWEDDDAWADRVHVLTIHKAKGLEFPVVFLIGLVQGRFPTPQRHEAIELPEPLIKDILPTGDYHLQEERRLFYVGMTRAQEALYLTCAQDYGGKTRRKLSRFVAEALDLPAPGPAPRPSAARERIERAKPAAPLPVGATARPRQGLLRLDVRGVDDYQTCPLKYRYSHVLRLPILQHHPVVYGTAMHKAIEAFFRRRLQQQEMTEPELLDAFAQAWHSEGFLSREHEEQRFAKGQEVLRNFFSRQQAEPEHPHLIEEKFSVRVGDIVLTGRWDRVDLTPEGAVIIDYKSSDVKSQADANRHTQQSLQLRLYALAWQALQGELPARVELRFLDTGLIGQARFSPEELDEARSALALAAKGIRKHAYAATPQDHACRWCAYQRICPFAFQP